MVECSPGSGAGGLPSADVGDGAPTFEAPEAPEQEVAAHLARRGLVFALPLASTVGFAWGPQGAVSAAYGVIVVVANFILAARLTSAAARRGPTALAAAMLGGYVLRLASVAVAVLAFLQISWAEVWPLGLALAFTHLGLLATEIRHVSATLAEPGLKPSAKPPGSGEIRSGSAEVTTQGGVVAG